MRKPYNKNTGKKIIVLNLLDLNINNIKMFSLWMQYMVIFSILTCLQTVWCVEDCSFTLQIPRRQSYDDLIRPDDDLLKRIGQRELRFVDDMIKELDECAESECLVVRGSRYFKQFKICKGSSVCYPKIGRSTVKTSTDSVAKTIQSKSCNPLAIGMLALGMGLGSVTMAIVCVFVPSLHRTATKLINKKAMKERPSQSTQSTRSRQSNSSTRNNQIIQQAEAAIINHQVIQPYEQPTYVELDQQAEPSIYQTLDHVDAQRAHVYTRLAQRPTSPNEVRDDLAKNRTIKQKGNNDHNRGHSEVDTVTKNSLPVDSTGYVIMKQTIDSRNERRDTTNEIVGAYDRYEHSSDSYFKLERHSNQDEVERTPEYVKLEQV